MILVKKFHIAITTSRKVFWGFLHHQFQNGSWAYGTGRWIRSYECTFYLKCLGWKMCEMQRISASTKVAIYSKKKPGHQQLCCGLNLSYLSDSGTVICVEGSDDVLSTLCSSCKWVGSGGHFAPSTRWLLSCDWGRKTVWFERLMLKVVIYSYTDFVELLDL